MMKVMKRSGLGVVEFTQDASPYSLGDRVRMSPADAEKFAGLFKEAKVREGEPMMAAPRQEPQTLSPHVSPHPAPGIPDDFESMHELQRVKIAEQIAKRPVKRNEADSIIRAELARRLSE